MLVKKKIIGGSLLVFSVLLGGCGGASDTSDSSSIVNESLHPKFSRLAVVSSALYEPSGEITERKPAFTWKGIDGAIEYRLGIEDAETETRWTEYTLSFAQANCATSHSCSSILEDLVLNIGDEKVWWVQARTSSGWQDWSEAHVFKVINMTPSVLPQPITPSGVITTETPTFKFTPGNGPTDYEIGMEGSDSDWETLVVSASQANCSATECSFKPNGLSFSTGDKKTWWVRDFHSGSGWDNWSSGLAFQIDTNTAYVPFKTQSNVSNIVEVNGKWYGILNDKVLLQDDGTDNISTLYTAPIKFEGGLSTSIPGKIFFKVIVSRGSTAHDNSHGSGASNAIISIKLANNEIKTELQNTNVTIMKQMTNYLIVSSYHRYSGRAPSKSSFYKIDKNSMLIAIGNTVHGRRTTFSIVSTDTANNRVIVSQRMGSSVKKSVVTDQVGVGLEDLTPFSDMPNVHDIVLGQNGLWYAIDASNTKLYSSDGLSASNKVYEADADFRIITKSEKNLFNKIASKKLFFAVEKVVNNRLKDASFIFFNTRTGQAEVLKTYYSTILTIAKDMNGYAYLTTQKIQFSPTFKRGTLKHVKVDNEGNIIDLGLSIQTNGDQLDFDYADTTLNEVHFNQLTNNQSVMTRKKITSKINTGLEGL